jgi:hypothetical protein
MRIVINPDPTIQIVKTWLVVTTVVGPVTFFLYALQSGAPFGLSVAFSSLLFAIGFFWIAVFVVSFD